MKFKTIKQKLNYYSNIIYSKSYFAFLTILVLRLRISLSWIFNILVENIKIMEFDGFTWALISWTWNMSNHFHLIYGSRTVCVKNSIFISIIILSIKQSSIEMCLLNSLSIKPENSGIRRTQVVTLSSTIRHRNCAVWTDSFHWTRDLISH